MSFGDPKTYYEHYNPEVTPDRLGYFQRLAREEKDRCDRPSPDASCNCTVRRNHGNGHVSHSANGSALAAWDADCPDGQEPQVVDPKEGEVRLPLGDRYQYDAIDEWDMLPDAGPQRFYGWDKKKG